MEKTNLLTSTVLSAQTESISPSLPYDSDMPSPDLDAVRLDQKSYQKGLLRFLVFSIIGVVVFFLSIPINGKDTVVFGFLYNSFLDLFGGMIYWVLFLIIVGNLGLHLYFKFVRKHADTSALARIYENDTLAHTVLYGLGAFYALMYALADWFPAMVTIEMVTGANTGGSVFPPIVKGVLGIIIIGAVFMPALLNYGILEIVGVLLEPLMRPLFKIPGKAALDAVASFVSSSSLGVLITNRLWRKNVYTDKEMVSIMTGFSAVSIGFAYLVIDTAGMAHEFIKIYGLSFVLVFVMALIMIRIPPISRKADRFHDGRLQTDQDRHEGTRYSLMTIPTGFHRAIKRAAIAKGPVTDVKASLLDSLLVLPQVLTMLSAIGVSAMILAEYTPVFTWLGYAFQPLLSLLAVPNSADIAASMPIGIAEMFLPVLIIQSKIGILSEQARAFVCIVSMVQIIFFSETATVMMATKSPIKFREIIICFIERTILAIPLAALCIHLFF